MTIFHGKLLLSEQPSHKNLNLPIDIFLRSLAKDQRKNAIAIILSGTGSDGTLGVKAIKEFGGMNMVQDLKSAKFDGMPRSSQATGMVDIIQPPELLAKELISYFKHPVVKETNYLEKLLDSDENYLSKIIAVLRDATGVDFSDYKENTIIRRLEKRISINRYNNIEEYFRFLVNNAKEIDVLFNELLIGVTRFFRDEDAYNELKKKAIIPLLKNTTSKELRIWVPGCSTGEEAYSIAIIFKEVMLEQSLQKELKIFATDIDTNSLDFASIGYYPANIASDVTTERIIKNFTKKTNGYQINDDIRSMIIFAKHNLINDPPFSKIDLISCRNLLIYINNDVQQKVLSVFHHSLNNDGFLFLGSSESLGNLSDNFATINIKAKLFKCLKNTKPPIDYNYSQGSAFRSKNQLKSVSSYFNPFKNKPKTLQGVFLSLMEDHLPDSVIINSNYEIVYTIGSLSEYISLPTGTASLNLIKMLSKENSLIVSSLLRQAEKKDTEIHIENIIPSSKQKPITISCKRIHNSENDDIYFLLSFQKEKGKKQAGNFRRIEKTDINSQYQERIVELEKELQNKSESLQATVEELETSNEELQSSNEELIASNEELQSTNEELQSVNEELYTVNSEHIRKIDELTELNADMDNLLKNTHIGNLFLDNQLNIRKINAVASKLTNILPTDIGRPIQHISVNNLYPDFIKDIRSVNEKLLEIDKEVLYKDNQWFLMRILPYRAVDNAVNGIIITFIDISKLKKSTKEVSDISDRLQKALEMGKMAWWEWDYLKNRVRYGKSKRNACL